MWVDHRCDHRISGEDARKSADRDLIVVLWQIVFIVVFRRLRVE
jgi:hypothetical protein